MNYDKEKSIDVIKNIRQITGLSQEKFAERIGYSRDQIAKVEIGKSNLDIDLLVRLANISGRTMEEIVTGVVPENNLYGIGKRIEHLSEEKREYAIRTIDIILHGLEEGM